MSKEEKEKQGFKVTDRRGFTAEGDRREEEEAAPPPGPEKAKEPAGPAAAPPPPRGAEPGREGPRGHGQEAPVMDFSSFVLSLATTAMVHLGEVPEPGGKTRQNLDAAKQMVDILGMLDKKTEGNRTPEESQLLEEVLYELRMKFLSKSNMIQL